jgi:hypothetical protein
MNKRLLSALMALVMLAPTAVHAEDMKTYESMFDNPKVSEDITEDGPQSPDVSNRSGISKVRPTSAVAGILGTAAVAIGGLLGLRFLNKRKTNASKTSDPGLIPKPSSPQSKEEDPTPGSEQPPKREEDQDEEEPVPVFTAGDQPKHEQVEVKDHPPVLEEGVKSKEDLVDEGEQTPTSKEDEQRKDEQDEEDKPEDVFEEGEQPEDDLEIEKDHPPVLKEGEQPEDDLVDEEEQAPTSEEGKKPKDDLVDEEEQTPTSKEDEKPKDEQDEEKDPSPASDQQPPSDSGQLTYDSEGRPLDSNQLPPASEEGVGHTHSSNPQPELDPPQQQSVSTSSGNQRPASSHDSGLPPGCESNEKVRKFLENGFSNFDEVVILLNAVREELRWTSKILSQLIHACTFKTVVGLFGTWAGYPFI